MISRVIDAAAAAACGASVFLIAVQVKPMPSTIEKALTPEFGLVWASVLLVSSLAATIGALFRRRSWALLFEYGGWLGMAGMALTYGGATMVRFGLVTSMVTVGFTCSLSLLCLGRWWGIHAALWRAQRRAKAGDAA